MHDVLHYFQMGQKKLRKIAKVVWTVMIFMIAFSLVAFLIVPFI